MADMLLGTTKVNQKQLVLLSSKLFVSKYLQIYQASLNLTIEIKELKITHKQVTAKYEHSGCTLCFLIDQLHEPRLI